MIEIQGDAMAMRTSRHSHHKNKQPFKKSFKKSPLCDLTNYLNNIPLNRSISRD